MASKKGKKTKSKAEKPVQEVVTPEPKAEEKKPMAWLVNLKSFPAKARGYFVSYFRQLGQAVRNQFWAIREGIVNTFKNVFRVIRESVQKFFASEGFREF